MKHEKSSCLPQNNQFVSQKNFNSQIDQIQSMMSKLFDKSSKEEKDILSKQDQIIDKIEEHVTDGHEQNVLVTNKQF